MKGKPATGRIKKLPQEQPEGKTKFFFFKKGNLQGQPWSADLAEHCTTPRSCLCLVQPPASADGEEHRDGKGPQGTGAVR